MIDLRQLRRAKSDPCADFWHVLRIGCVVGAVLFFTLPRLIG